MTSKLLLNRNLALFLSAALVALLTACSDSSDNEPVIDLTPLLQQYLLSSEDSVPEGVAFDAHTRSFYATSLQGGSITRVAADGQESTFREADSTVQLLGAKVDTDNRRLWVCSRGVAEGVDNSVRVYDLDSGAMTMEFLLGALATGGTCNDLALDTTGTAYVTDSANPNIYHLDPATGEGSIFSSDPLFNDISTFGLGLNGIAVSPDDSALIVGKFISPSLFKVSIPNADITPIALTGDFPSPDGLAVLDGDLFAVSGDSVSRVRLNVDYTAGDVINVPQISGLSTATVAQGELYVIKSEVTNFFFGLPLATPFEIFQVDRAAFDQ